MKKKILLTLMLVVFGVIVLGTFSVSAASSGTCGTNLTWKLDSSGTLTISGQGDMDDGSYSSDVPWYSSRENITKVVVKNGVTSIGNYAFYGCSSLKTVTIPTSVTSIGSDAFYNCSSLTNITIPSKVTSIGDYAFYGCSSFTSITIPDGITSISRSAFGACTNLTEVKFPSQLTSIENYAFSSCKGLTTLKFPENLKTIGDSAFRDCTNLSSVVIYNTIEKVKQDAFWDCAKPFNIYFNGSQGEWNVAYGSKIEMGSFNYGSIHPFYYVNILDSYDNELCEIMQPSNQAIDTDSLPRKGDYSVILFTDAEYNNKFDITQQITENLSLYLKYEFPMLNKIKMDGDTSAEVGTKEISQKVIYASENSVMYCLVEIKYPQCLYLDSIIPKDFKYAEKYSEKAENGYMYLTVVSQYSDDENAPSEKILTPFELVFNVSEEASPNAITLDILESSCLIEENSYSFIETIGKTFEIKPKLIEKIEILGDDTVAEPQLYTAKITPDYASNKIVKWSVDDETIATISQDGTVAPIKNGTVVITATAQDGSEVFATKTVNVVAYAKINSLDFGNGVVLTEFNPDVRKYTIYVKEDASSISLTSTFSGGVLRTTGSSIVISGISKEFEIQENGITTITLNRENVPDMTNSVYTIEVVKFEGTKTTVSEDKKSFTIKPINIENGKTVILALYNGEQFVEMQSLVYTGESIPFTTTKSYTKAKVMVWDDFKTLKPVCEVENVQ